MGLEKREREAAGSRTPCAAANLPNPPHVLVLHRVRTGAAEPETTSVGASAELGAQRDYAGCALAELGLAAAAENERGERRAGASQDQGQPCPPPAPNRTQKHFGVKR